MNLGFGPNFWMHIRPLFISFSEIKCINPTLICTICIEHYMGFGGINVSKLTLVIDQAVVDAVNHHLLTKDPVGESNLHMGCLAILALKRGLKY